MSKFLVSNIARFAAARHSPHFTFPSSIITSYSPINIKPCRFCSSSSSSDDSAPAPKLLNKENIIQTNDKPQVSHRREKSCKPNTSPISIKNAMAHKTSPSPQQPQQSIPACAAFHKMTPLTEHEIGLDFTKRHPNQASSAVKPVPSLKSPDEICSAEEDEVRRKRTSKKKGKKCKYGLELLSQADCFRRAHFGMKMLFMLEDEPEILNNILFTDECNFNLPRLPPPIIMKPPIAQSDLLPQICWCGMSTKGVLGPYFFNSHVTDKTYLKMLENYVLPELESKGYNLKELWFQQDGASWHCSKKVLDFLKSVFDYRVISLGTKFLWPPRSQDLTPLDYFFWNHVKDRLNYKHTKYELCFQTKFREILTREVNQISAGVLRKAIYQIPERLELCVNANGDRFYDLLIEPTGTIQQSEQCDVDVKRGPAKPPKSNKK